ncbi:superkiller viralicidic activity 2-like 2 isoform 1 [Camelus ferus]|nr:superkiller viralicidic activity 2-like 2 isoform 1 [Camelus ferus]
MADAFGDELFSVFEDDSTAAPGTKKDKEKEKGRWKGPSGSAEKTGKHFDGKLQSESTNIGKTKRDADFEGTDEPFFGKKSRVEESVTEDLRYAIALALREKQRVIFTSPIKALSNQKYREMYEEFQDVGLMTGDVTINPTASCLVMTTEILRSMLYRGSEVMREVAWVIFDEIHYMRDSDEEKKMVEEVFSNAIDCLSDEDKKLPQVEHVLPLLKRGIGIHHGGLLPILKETIEILFSEGLIKISSGEYIQMSGRAGRRGMDDRGIVILMVDEKMSPTIGKQLLKGSADPLNSAFHLTYNMVLNLLRVEEINPEYMLEKSFYQFQHYRAIPGVVEKVKNSEEQYNKIVIPNEESVVIYYKIRQQLAKLGKEIEEYIHKPKYCLPFLQPGRLVKVKNEGDDFGWGVVVNFSKKSNVKPNSGELDPLYVVEVLLRCSKESLKNSATEAAKPAKPDEKGEMQEVQKRFPDGVPLLDPIDDMGIQDQGLKKVIQKVEAFEHRMYSHPLHNDPNLETVYTLCEKKAQIAIDIKSAKRELKKARTVLQMDELKCRKRVLRRLGFATSSDVIEMKGRVACEISSADELLLTEMMFNGLFNDLSAEQATALLSCFVFQENSSEMPKLTEQLAGPLRQMQECAKRIAKVSAEAKLEIDEETYLSSFKPHLMDVVYTWATGATFAHICKMTDVFEGSIIRCMRRLEELLRQMCQAAKAIGNTELENKFAEGQYPARYLMQLCKSRAPPIALLFPVKTFPLQ